MQKGAAPWVYYQDPSQSVRKRNRVAPALTDPVSSSHPAALCIDIVAPRNDSSRLDVTYRLYLPEGPLLDAVRRGARQLRRAAELRPRLCERPSPRLGRSRRRLGRRRGAGRPREKGVVWGRVLGPTIAGVEPASAAGHAGSPPAVCEGTGHPGTATTQVRLTQSVRGYGSGPLTLLVTPPGTGAEPGVVLGDCESRQRRARSAASP